MTMPTRLPAIARDQMQPDQVELLDSILSGPRGNLNGPFVAWIHSPRLGQLAQRLGAFCRYDTGLPLRLSELAILATAVQWQSQAEWHIHQPIAVTAGLSPALTEQLRQGLMPAFEAEDERLIWSFATELYRHRRVCAATYAQAIEMFGMEVVVNLVGLLGYYALVAMTLNTFGMRAEGQGEDALPFDEPVG